MSDDKEEDKIYFSLRWLITVGIPLLGVIASILFAYDNIRLDVATLTRRVDEVENEFDWTKNELSRMEQRREEMIRTVSIMLGELRSRDQNFYISSDKYDPYAETRPPPVTKQTHRPPNRRVQ